MNCASGAVYYRSHVNMALSIQYWTNYTSNNTKLQRKSENAVASNHILSFNIDFDVSVLNATVQASMRDRSYKLMVSCKSIETQIIDYNRRYNCFIP